MPEEPTRPDDELERLKLQKQRLELKAQIDALTAPWWRKASLIATMTAIIAAILPVTTAIQKHYENQRELALQEARQENDIRMAYLEEFQVPGQRLLTLRFLLATSTDPRLLAWARAEQKIVEEQLDSIRTQIRAALKELDQTPAGPRADALRAQVADLLRLLELKTVAPETGPRPPAGSTPAPPPAEDPAAGATVPVTR